MTLEEFDKYFWRFGRGSQVAVLIDSYIEGEIDKDILAAYITTAWSGTEYPLECAPKNLWELLFKITGYISEDKRSERPTEPVELFRGSIHKYRRRMSWTSDLDKARWFAKRFDSYGGDPANVYRTVAPPESLYCFIGAENRNESEYVVNTRGLKIKLFEGK